MLSASKVNNSSSESIVGEVNGCNVYSASGEVLSKEVCGGCQACVEFNTDVKTASILNIVESKVGRKFDTGKVRMSLLPKGTLNEVLEVLEMGAVKYDIDNWKQVSNPQERYYNAMQRHIDSWWNNEVIDPESKRHHLAHAVCCAMFLMWFDANEVPNKDLLK